MTATTPEERLARIEAELESLRTLYAHSQRLVEDIAAVERRLRALESVVPQWHFPSFAPMPSGTQAT